MGTSALPRIKVCGIRGIEDLPQPVPAALDAVGFVGWPRSPRYMTPEDVARIVDELPRRVTAVAVLVDAYAEEADRWLAVSGCRAVQVCGDETPREWAGFPHPVLRRVPVDGDAEEEIEAWTGIAALFVLDHPASPGGTGREVDARLARDLAARAPCLLAGGLSDETVAAHVARIRPHGVDASSRLERADGRKDPERVRAFVAAADRALRDARGSRAPEERR